MNQQANENKQSVIGKTDGGNDLKNCLASVTITRRRPESIKKTGRKSEIGSIRLDGHDSSSNDDEDDYAKGQEATQGDHGDTPMPIVDRTVLVYLYR